MGLNEIRLGVNIDHVATIRNARGTSYPDPLMAAKIVKEAGGILESIEENLNPIETGNVICSNNQEEVFNKFSDIIRSSVQ